LHRLILFFLILFAIYYLFKRWVRGFFGQTRQGPERKPPPIIDELVKDPVCGTYVPKREAIVYGKKGKLYYFCSKECLEKFKKESGPKDNEA